jgi:hypothetical protein
MHALERALQTGVGCAVVAVALACHAHDSGQPSACAGAQEPAVSASAAPLPTSVDLRPQLESLGLAPRAQGPRGTCSIFTTCASIEFALAKHIGHAQRLSPEFLNWAAGRAAGGPSDGNFFHNALAGFSLHGICAEESLPYRASFDASLVPSPPAVAEAARLRDHHGGSLVAHWTVPWQPNRFGVDDEQLREIEAVLARGYPVAAGSGHSRLLVGYREDASAPGGGVFMTSDSALARFDEVTFEFVRNEVADVFWIEAR